ncbi:MAG: sugar phosphate isomerase/epimerase [Eubacteriales bacterium]|jgi:D-psicose/D-tagatose/L-ribulose 3-epimerase|nr:sugar phosphate isomerase/epimerase [Eubacteriales bacterium]
MIRLGCCIPGASFMPEGVGEVDRSTYGILSAGCRTIRDTGYDYAEAAVGLLMKMTGEEYKRAKDEGEIRIEAANSFIPGHMHISKISDEMTDFIDRAMERVSGLGAGILVFGSGASRRVPEGVSREEGLAHLTDFLTVCDEYAGKHGITLALEPLNTRETNMINTLAEGASLVRRMMAAGCDNIKLLADTYHMSREGLGEDRGENEYNEESFTVLGEAEDIIVHAHAAEPFDRTYPGSHDGVYLTRFAEALKKTAYGGRVSVECGFSDFIAESALALKFFRGIF